jgi:hypothetical protein
MALGIFLPNGQLHAQNERFREGGGSTESTRAEEPKPKARPQAQSSPQTLMDRLVFGGGAGFSFGNNTQIFLSPQVGYQVSDNAILGLGFNYNYVRVREIFVNGRPERVNFENTIYGPTAFGSYNLMESFFVGFQGEYLNHDAYLGGSTSSGFGVRVENRWTPVLFLQGGFFQKIGERGFAQIGLRYNILHDGEGPYFQSWSPIFLFFF